MSIVGNDISYLSFFFTLFWDLFGCLKGGPKFHKDHYEMFVKIIFEEGGFAFCSAGLDFSGRITQ